MQAISTNRITQTSHGTSKAVDYSAKPDPTIYAPEDGTIDSYQQRGSGTSDAGLALRMRGASGLHQFAHTERSLVQVGQQVKRGQPLAIMGHTGYTIPEGPAGAHCHWWIQRSNGTYVYPPSIINEAFIKGDEPMFNEGDRVNINNYLYGKDNGFFKEMVGKPWKSAIYELFENQNFKFQHYVNDGDVANINGALGRTDAGNIKGKNWKEAAYDYFLKIKPTPTPPTDEYVPYQQPQLYTKK